MMKATVVKSDSNYIIPFPGPHKTTASIVGGKAFSLIRLTEEKFDVPPGVVLTTRFFAPWFTIIQTLDAWQRLVKSDQPELEKLSKALKEFSLNLEFDAAQSQALRSVQCLIADNYSDKVFAVRSSAPDEDGDLASFAGGYETVLGVSATSLESAIQHCFASSLDSRVFSYKQQQGLDFRSPTFALIIQVQIDSEVSGVGFSLNPMTNDYDEAVIDSNWGLGESVVAGEVTPDHFVVDKVDQKLLERKIGNKALAYFLNKEGGSEKRQQYRSNQLSLTDKQVIEVNQLISQVEDLYKKPVDIEWTFHKERLYLLQARPITTFVPLHKSMLTRFGERRRLYSDIMLSKGYTTNAPCSPLEMSCMQDTMFGVLENITGKNATPENAMITCEGNRAYFNISPVLRLISPQHMAKSTNPTDVLLSKILDNVDRAQYKSAARPRWLSFSAMMFLLKIVWRFKSVLFFQPVGLVFGSQEKYKKLLEQSEVAKNKLKNELDFSIGVRGFRQKISDIVFADFLGPMGTLLMASLMAQGLLTKIVGRKNVGRLAKVDALKRGFADDVVVQMGIMMHGLASQLQATDFSDLDSLAKKIHSGDMPEKFMIDWKKFIDEFGCRGPEEMDSASPRYGDDINLALSQMAFMVNVDDASNPSLVLQRQVREREQAYQQLIQELSGWRRRLLRRCYRVIDAYAGHRDTPKYLIVLGVYAFKRRALMEGEKFVQQGRLDSPKQIFGFFLSDIENADKDPNINLRDRYLQRMEFYNQLKRQVKYFPSVIDSRGRILRPKPIQEAPGQHTGTGVSAGVARGPVKILETSDQKPINKGDILVAYTTDPGWTPLFVNAAAIVLEIGGVLQHGAVVAREYGKPCVVGIDRVAEKLSDGQMVEVDGNTGCIRLIGE